MKLLTSEKMERINERLRLIVAKNIKSDEKDFNVFDYSGGNFDDAFALGIECGEASLAKELLEKYFKGYGE